MLIHWRVFLVMLSTYKILEVFTSTEVKWVKIPPPPANPSSFRDNPSSKMRWIFSKAGGWSISRLKKKNGMEVQLEIARSQQENV